MPGRWRAAPGWRLQFRARSAKPPPYDRMIRMTRRAGAAPMLGRRREASMPGWLQVYNNKAACSCPSSLSKFGGGTWTSGDKICPSSLSKFLSKFRFLPRRRIPNILLLVVFLLERGAPLPPGPTQTITRQPAVVQVPCPSSAGELGQVAL